jgi:VWFA-related protein
MSSRPAALVAALACLGAAPFAFQQNAPVFRSEANYVEVTARVVDRDGRFIDGLTATDFRIQEDHRPQAVETVARVDLPTPWGAGRTATAPAYSPDLARELRVANGRVYLMYLSSAGSNDVPVTRKIAKEFVTSYLHADDVVALWSLNGLVAFTSDRDRLHAGIDLFLGDDETFQAVRGTKDVGMVEPSLNSALDWFSRVQGRKKSVLLFTAGMTGLGPVNSETSIPSRPTYLLDRPDVQVYAIDTRGLAAPTYRSTAGAAANDAAQSITGQASSFFSSLMHLKWMAEDTGGFAILNHNDYQDGFKRIVEENSTYYVLGYQSTAKKRPNWDYREISVKVTRAGLGGARVQARKGYVAR